MRILFGLFLLSAFTSFAQKSQYNWYFGRYAAISFESGTGLPIYDNPQNIYGKSVSISDQVTGKLLFYSDGSSIWNGNHNLLVNGSISTASPNGDLIIVPFPKSTSKYYLFFISSSSSLQYVVVDMSLQNGNGEVISSSPQTLSNNKLNQITAIKHQYTDAYWIVTHEIGNNTFHANLVDMNGVSTQAVNSDIGITTNSYGDMVASNQGHKIAVTHYLGNNNNVEVFDFDRTCGVLSNARVLNKESLWDYAFGIAFSPDDSKLYITFSYELSQLVQYYGNNYENSYFIASSPSNFNIMRLGPDGKIYIATHDNGIPGKRIDAILKPNEIAGSCFYQKTHITLDEGAGKNRSSQFELPAFAAGKSSQSPIKDSIFSVSNTCEGDTTAFHFNTSNPFDSLRWIFHDAPTSNSTLINPTYQFNKAGTFRITLHIYRCGNNFELIDSVTIKEKPVLNFPSDTTICLGSTIKLNGPICEKYNWSSGEITSSIIVAKTGNIWLTASNGNCTNSDTILIKNYPEIITLLGDEFYLCEDDQELVKLNAGEGFSAYKWTPTNDTTSWIIVKNIGDYFVKVTDNYGCIGNDQTKVKRRCSSLLYIPTVFSPNNDGTNDVFKPIGLDIVTYEIEIYNRWGQRIFNSTKLEDGWNGTFNSQPADLGVYVYTIKYSGYRNKLLKDFVVKGHVTLMR